VGGTPVTQVAVGAPTSGEQRSAGGQHSAGGQRAATGTRIETANDPPVGSGATGGRRRRTIAALVAAIAVLAAVGLGLLALRDDDSSGSDDETAGESPGTSAPTAGDTPDGDSGGYCARVTGAWPTLDLIGSGDDLTWSQFGRAVETIHATRLAAPPDVADAWRRIDRPFQRLQAAVEDTGLGWEELDDLEEAGAGFGPDGPALRSAATRFGDDIAALDQDQIGGVIVPHARVECDVDLTAL
jgi:hypothetical protein